MNPPTIKELRERLGLTPADAKCLRRLMGITMRRQSEPRDEGALGAPGPYVNRNLVPAVLRFACWAMGSGGTRSVLVPDGASGKDFDCRLTYDRVAQYVAVDDAQAQPTLWYDHMRSRWLVATWREFWGTAPVWMGFPETARIVADRKGPADEHARMVHGAPLQPTRSYVTAPGVLDPEAVAKSDAGKPYARI